MKQRLVLNDIAPDFARDGQEQEAYLREKQEATVRFIEDYLEKSGAKGIVLGISGGVDSYVVGALCAKACAARKKQLILCPLPNGRQADYQDAADSVDAIKMLYLGLKHATINISGGYQGVLDDMRGVELFEQNSYSLGNIQARLRMVYQYALAGGMLVAGTDHAAEGVTGFFTKYGDGGADIMPISELVKDDVYAMARQLGAPQAVVEKQPAAGLGISKTDEEEMGVSYADICAYLRGNVIDAQAAQKIEGMYTRSMHKRALPATMRDAYTQAEPVTHVAVDFIHAFVDGSMALENAPRAVEAAAGYINAHPEQVVLYVCDSHPAEHCSFEASGGPWPEHAVQGTEDAAIVPAFYESVKKTVNTPVLAYNVFRKGEEASEEQYSGFGAKNAAYGLLKDNLTHKVIVSGGATEYCVKNTVEELLAAGHDVSVLKEGLCWVDENGHAEALAQMEAMGARIVSGL